MVTLERPADSRIFIPLTKRRPRIQDIDFTKYDIIILNTSGGKDSQETVRLVVAEAIRQGFRGKFQAVHADLGDVEWEGVRELAEEQCRIAGIPFETVAAWGGADAEAAGKKRNLLEYMIRRGKFPSNNQRYCTSDYKRGPVRKVFTRMVREHREREGWGKSSKKDARRVQVLNVMGMRAAESPARAKKEPLEWDEKASNGLRDVWNYLPIHHFSTEEVWDGIHESKVPYHWVYDLGLGRLSCVFCIFAPFLAMVLAGVHNQGLLGEYVAAEADMTNDDGSAHTWRRDFSLADVERAVGTVVKVLESEGRHWSTCRMVDVKRIMKAEGAKEEEWNM